MKRLLIITAICIVTSLQSLAAPRIILADAKENYTQTTTGYILNFKLVCTSDELVKINGEVQSLSDRLAIQVAEGSDNTRDCVFTINHQNQPEYAYKMLLSIGIADLEYKGNVQSLDTIIQILYSYL